MIFAHPFALLGLLLVPVLIAFYFWRAQHQRQVVSSTWLWKEVQARFSQQPSRRLLLREPLLLLQILATLLLTVLLAGPVRSQTEHLHQIVILDGSMTMNASDTPPTRWTAALQRLRAVVNARGTDEQISLVLAGAQARLIGEIPGGVDLTRLLQTLPPPAGAPDLAGAVALARGLANEGGASHSRILFLAGAQTPALSGTGLPVTTQRFGGPLDDQEITTFTARCLPSGSCQAFARVRNTATAARLDTLAVWADNHLLGRQVLHLPAAGSLDLDFAIPAGAHAVRASLLRPDAIAADNTAWTVTPLPQPRAVLVVSDAPGQLVPALRAVPGLTVQQIGTSAYQDALAAGKDLVVLDHFVPDSLPPNPVLVSNPPADSWLVHTTATSVFLPITQINAQDPVVSGLDLYHLALVGSSVDVPTWAQWAATGTHGPAIVDGTLDGLRVAILPWDAAHSPATQDPVFPLLIDHLVQWLAPDVTPSLPLGATLTLPAGVLSLRAPDGTVLQGPVVTATQPGLYQVAESIGTRGTGDALFSVPAVVDATTPTAPSTPSWTALAAPGALPQSLWPLVAALALAALCGEWWFYTRKT